MRRGQTEREGEDEGKVREAGNGEKEEELNKLLRIRLHQVLNTSLRAKESPNFWSLPPSIHSFFTLFSSI